ncbi:MAG: hypothetical protein JEY71_00575 [Sphaerochaeta sp.]|nr:hypothetical protein [Sphaerochaeta sp.]
MDPNSTRGRDLFMEIREAMDSLGRWEADAKAGRKVINRFVSILNKGIDDPRVKGKGSYPLSEIIVLRKFAYILTILAERKGAISKKEGNLSIQLFDKPTIVKRLLFGKIPRMSA